MPYNVQIRNYDQRTEETPLTVGSAASTDGTFSTITLDSTIAKNSSNHHQQQTEETPRSSSPLHLLLFVSWALIEGLIQVQYHVWWAVGMNAALVSTGIASLFADRRGKKVHLVTLLVWMSSAVTGFFLFSIFVIWRGQDYIPGLCLAYANEKYSDHEITMGVCAALADDGTFEKIWIGAIVLGVLFGFPFMIFAVLTVHRFYIDSSW